MATTDHDAPRQGAVDVQADGLDELTARREAAATQVIDIDGTAVEFEFELPGGDILDEEQFTMAVVPMHAHEFRCDRCFLVHHRNQLAHERGGMRTCRECA